VSSFRLGSFLIALPRQEYHSNEFPWLCCLKMMARRRSSKTALTVTNVINGWLAP
jgi:hypothetical protein